MDHILQKYIYQILSCIPNGYKENSQYFNFRCHICGDSEHNKFKRRAYILKNKEPWMYFCHNCGYSTSVKKWIKSYFREYYDDYIKEYLSEKVLSEESFLESKKNLEEKNIKLALKEIKEKKKENDENIKFFKPITCGTPLADKAIESCRVRRIPESVYKHWYVCEEKKYKERMIIPFLNGKKVYFFQGRSLTNREPKYLNCSHNRNKAIYNIYNVDIKKPVIALEGVVDSLFVENSIAILGTKWPTEVDNILSKLDCYYIMDNDEPGKKVANSLLLNRNKVFMWKRFLESYCIDRPVKDINDVYIHLDRKQKFTFEELKGFFTDNILLKIFL